MSERRVRGLQQLLDLLRYRQGGWTQAGVREGRAYMRHGICYSRSQLRRRPMRV